MLDFVRRHSRSWIVKVLLWAVIIVFIGWGGYLYQTRHIDDIARVGDHYIDSTEYNKAYNDMVDQVRKQFGGALSEDLMRSLNLKQQALQSLVQHYVILQGAQRLGLAATTEEIRRTILQMPVFQHNGVFNDRLYENVLRENRMTPSTFEQQISDEITTRKVQAFIMGRAVVTQQEILAEYHFSHDRIKIAYVLFDPRSFLDGVKVKESDLQAFYKNNQKRYMEPEKREIAYVLLANKDFEKNIHPSKEEIKRYYEDNAAQFTSEKQMRARYILLRIKPGASKAEVEKRRAQAQKILDEARKGNDFAQLAEKYSQDEATAKKGGELGFFSYKQKDPAFSAAAFALKPGQISGLVRTSSGFDIIKCEEIKNAKTTPLEQVKDEIVKTLKSQGAQDIASKQAQSLRDLAYARKDIAKAAGELKMKVSDPVWITLSGDQSGSPFPGSVEAKLFQLGEGDVSDVLKVPNGFAVAQVKSIKRPQPFAFDKVKDKVTSDFRADQAKKLAQKQASETLAQAEKGKSLSDAAKTLKLNLEQSEFFSRQDPAKDLKLLQGDTLDTVFDLNLSKPFPQKPLELGEKFMVCQFLGKKPAGEPSQKEKAEIYDAILRQKQFTLWRAWITEVAKSTKIQLLRKI